MRTASRALLTALVWAVFPVFHGTPSTAAERSWDHPLYLGRGGIWRRRFVVTVSNESDAELTGRPVSLAVGSQRGQAPLAGETVDSLRVVDSRGVEMLYAVTSPDLAPQTRGPIAAGSMLTIPVVCSPRGTAEYWVYSGNESAWAVPDFLAGVSTGELNGSFEKGDGLLPAGWDEKSADAQHRNLWVTDHPHSGERCVKTEVDAEAEPNWVAVYRRGLSVVPGGTYTLTVWVRGRNVVGRSGWFIHVGNRTQPQLLSDLADAGDGTFDWRRLSMTFTVPEDATMLTTGSVLRGTGEAWFDDLTIESDVDDPVTVTPGPLETLAYSSLGGDAVPGPEVDVDPRSLRVPVRVPNFTAEPLGGVLGHVDLSQTVRGDVSSFDLMLTYDGKPVPCCQLGDALLFECDVPAMSVKTFYLYLIPASETETRGRAGGRFRMGSHIPSDHVFVPDRPGVDPRGYAQLLIMSTNLARNPSFEQGERLPDAWEGAGERFDSDSNSFGFGRDPAFGRRCVRVSVPHDAASDWVGWRQSVSVKAGRSYIYAAWVRTRDVQNGTVKIHAHQRRADGTLCETRGYLSAGTPAAGDTDWTLFAGFTEIPVDGAVLQVHLTMNATGTIEHDGVLVSEVVDAVSGTPEDTGGGQADGLAVWSVDPIIKVFRESLPPLTPPRDAAVSLARNESEPLQLVVRSPRDIPALEVVLDGPVTHRDGSVLPAPEVGWVGYVPIDHKTSYYRSESPVWERKFPTGSGSCDGWAGWWPDPVIPGTSTALEAGRTQPFWITFAAPTGVPAGDYRATILLRADGRELARVPLTVHVWDFAIPARPELAAIYDLRINPQFIRPGQTRDQTRDELMRFMASRKVSADRLQAEPVFVREGGAIRADFAAYDAEGELYFDELAFPRAYTPRFFYLFGWGHPPRTILGEAPYEGEYPYEDVDRSVLRPGYREAYQTCLALYWQHMKERGWADRIVLYISDEPHFRHERIRIQMKALCDMIHEVDPDIPIYSSTWRHCEEWNGYLDVWGVGQYGCFPVDEMERRAAAGDRLWFTTDGQMCTDTPYCAIERLLPHYCFAYDVEAYEFWGLTWLTYDPWEFGWHRYIHQSSEPGTFFFVRYPNGDGYLAYPGTPIDHEGPVSSIRLEQARDGVEDYQYLRLLEELVQASGDEEGRRLLAEARDLVPIPNAGGRHSTQILPHPEAVSQRRAGWAAAIERLSRQ